MAECLFTGFFERWHTAFGGGRVPFTGVFGYDLLLIAAFDSGCVVAGYTSCFVFGMEVSWCRNALRLDPAL